MPPAYISALKAFAFQSSVSLAEYVRGMVHDRVLQRGAAFRERGAAFRVLIKAGKACFIAYHLCVTLAAFNSQDTEGSWKSKSDQPWWTD